jgi:hypothetical protein
MSKVVLGFRLYELTGQKHLGTKQQAECSQIGSKESSIKHPYHYGLRAIESNHAQHKKPCTSHLRLDRAQEGLTHSSWQKSMLTPIREK